MKKSKIVKKRPKLVKKRSNLAKPALRDYYDASRLPRIEKDESDYEELAESRGLQWVGDGLPKNTLEKTQWKCPLGHLFEARWADIYWGRGCGYCSGRAHKTKEDYVEIAKEAGIQYLGPMPKTTRHKTRWLGGDGKVLEATYQQIVQRYELVGEIRTAEEQEEINRRLGRTGGYGKVRAPGEFNERLPAFTVEQLDEHGPYRKRTGSGPGNPA